MEKNKTKEALAVSFKELVLTQPIEKITIKEITDRAGVIRATFYNHFQDKYELLEWIIKEELILPIIPLFHGGFMKEGMILIFINIENNKEFYTHAAKLEGQNSFASIVQKLIEEMVVRYIKSKKGENVHFREWMTAEMVAEYYARSIRYIATKWITTGYLIPPAELANLCEIVFESNLDDIINEMK